MNSKRLARVLAAPALIACGIAAVLCVWYLYTARLNLITQGEATRATLVMNSIRGLLADCAEYSKRDPELATVLKSLEPVATTNAVHRNASPAPTQPSSNTR